MRIRIFDLSLRVCIGLGHKKIRKRKATDSSNRGKKNKKKKKKMILLMILMKMNFILMKKKSQVKKGDWGDQLSDVRSISFGDDLYDLFVGRS
jgi:hypothetical protein